MVKLRQIVSVLVVVWLAACVKPPGPPAPTVSQGLFAGSTSAPLATPSMEPSATPNVTTTGSVTATATAIAPTISLCSPFSGYGRERLEDAISNPFRPPARPGSDDPHQAVDLAIIQNGMAVGGDVVNLMLGGEVAAVIEERFPYGNAIMIETPLATLPEEVLVALAPPTPAPTLGPHPSLNCPPIEESPEWDFESRSLYLLYAHMDDMGDFHLGDRVACGARIGVVGQSGNALNPHLHLEARIGPANARFNGLAHYETRATPEEMWSYCIWRVSGIFQLMDPVPLFKFFPSGDG